MKPEVDMKDEKVVNHVGVVAVLGMHIHDPGSRFIVQSESENNSSGNTWCEKVDVKKVKVKVKIIQVATPGVKK